MKASDSVSDQAKRNEDSYNAVVKKAREEEAAVRTIIAGQFERDNWLQMYKFINTAVPQPNAEEQHKFYIPAEEDGDEPEVVSIPDIPEEFKKRYWLDKPGGRGAMSGEQAFKEYRKRQIQGPSAKDEGTAGGADELGAGIEDLIQFNIESVDAFFCDNLQTYWSQILASPRVRSGGKNMVRPESDFARSPDGSGWIIEIQGYTYHRDAETFVRTTLLENLARLGIQKPKAEAPPAPGAAAPGGARPASPGLPGTPPGTPAAVPGQPPPAGGEPAEDKGPVINHISHVVLYEYRQSSPKREFEVLGRTTHNQVRTMALGGTSTAGPGGMIGMQGGMSGPRPPENPPPGMPSSGPPGGGMMGGRPGATPGTEPAAAAGPSRESWIPLGEAAAAGSGPPGMFPGATGRDRTPSRMPPGRPGTTPGMPMGRDGRNPPPAELEAGPKRTEFVILLVWKEPTPSDALRGQAAAAGTPGGPTAGAASANPTPQPPPGRGRGGRSKRGGRGKRGG